MILPAADPEESQDQEFLDEREIWRDGAMRIDAAEAFSGLAEGELYALMDAGQIAWYPKGAKRIRMIARASLVDYLTNQHRQHRRKVAEHSE